MGDSSGCTGWAGIGLKLAVAVMVSLLGAVVWLAFFYRQDRGEPEPPGRVAFAALLGAVAVLPAAGWESWALQWIDPVTPAGALISAFLVVGLGEEALKFAAAYGAAYRLGRRAIQEPIDAVVYAIAAGLGFAAVENVIYARAFGLAVLPLRAVVGFAVHASLAGVFGYVVGMKVAGGEPLAPAAVRGVAGAAFLHGLYDFAIASRWLSPGGVLLAVAALYMMLATRIHAAQEGMA